ncbi:MAG: hypothetical protein PHT07_10245 [Paludibacter sp.]|nr:hypothetical protein [Paludibacter sp.]
MNKSGYVMVQVTACLPVENGANGKPRVHVFMQCGHSSTPTVQSWNKTRYIVNMPATYYIEEKIKARCYKCAQNKE